MHMYVRCFFKATLILGLTRKFYNTSMYASIPYVIETSDKRKEGVKGTQGVYT